LASSVMPKMLPWRPMPKTRRTAEPRSSTRMIRGSGFRTTGRSAPWRTRSPTPSETSCAMRSKSRATWGSSWPTVIDFLLRTRSTGRSARTDAYYGIGPRNGVPLTGVRRGHRMTGELPGRNAADRSASVTGALSGPGRRSSPRWERPRIDPGTPVRTHVRVTVRLRCATSSRMVITWHHAGRRIRDQKLARFSALLRRAFGHPTIRAVTMAGMR
jgi:hypothetical protein